MRLNPACGIKAGSVYVITANISMTIEV